MKKRNRILSLLLAGVMALGLTACGASNAGAYERAPAPLPVGIKKDKRKQALCKSPLFCLLSLNPF